MSKRFIETTIWTQNKWFRKLPINKKVFWIYLISNCDSVGVWEEDVELASFIIGHEYNIKKLLETYGDRIHVFNNKKWWIKDFCNFQYGVLKEENITNKPHQSYISLLKKHSLWIVYGKSIDRFKDKDKDKEEEKEKEKEKGFEIGKKEFEYVWKLYPSKVGKEKSFKSFIKSVKTKDDLSNIITALNNYVNSERVKNGYVRNGSTWFNSWKDWVDYVDTKPKTEQEKKPDTKERAVYSENPEYSKEPRASDETVKKSMEELKKRGVK